MLLIICLIGGLVWGLLYTWLMSLAGFPMDWQDALLSGLLFGLLIYPCFHLMGRGQKRRVEAAQQKLPSPPTHGWLAIMGEGKQSRSVAVFLCEDCLCLADIGSKAVPISTYPCTEIVRAAIPAANRLEIHLSQGRTLQLRTGGNTEEILSALKERGWLPFQH